jgi:hypothetical protein
MWSILGSLSNAVAAICAVAAIWVTIRNFKIDKEEQKEEKLSIKLSELYKQAVIDSMLKTEEEKIRYMNDKLYKMSSDFNKDIMEELSDYMISGTHECLLETEIVKLFSKELYQEIKKGTEQIFDEYGKIINKSMQSGYVSKYFEDPIRKEWINLKNRIYQCYIEENFSEI